MGAPVRTRGGNRLDGVARQPIELLTPPTMDRRMWRDEVSSADTNRRNGGGYVEYTRSGTNLKVIP